MPATHSHESVVLAAAPPSAPPPSQTSPASPLDLRVRDLGRMRYADAFDLQKRLQREVIEARSLFPEHTTGLAYLLLVEHDPPVITISRRPGARTHLLASEVILRKAGIEVVETDRGGDITYHGPGQLVVYPIIDLNRFGFRIDTYMRFLEQIVIDSLRAFGITGARDACATGVWVKPTVDAHGLQSVGVTSAKPPTAKICAMGVRISRWVSMHGFALNATTNLDHFNFIVPCGLAGRSVTSMSAVTAERGQVCPSMQEVKATIIERFKDGLADR